MTFLIAKIIFLVLAAALFGAWIMYWWISNRQEDVTESYSELKSRSDSVLKNVEDLPTRQDLNQGLAAIKDKVDAQKIPDFDPLRARLTAIEYSVSNFSIPDTDLSPISERLQFLEAQISKPDPNFEHLHSRVTGLEESLNHVSESINRINPQPDFSPLTARMDQLEGAVNNIHIPESDLGPIHSSLALLELGIEGLDIPTTNLDPVHDHLRTLDAKLIELSDRIDNARKADIEVLTSRVASLSSTISSLDMPEIDPALEHVHAKLNKLEAQITDAISTPAPPAQTIDLAPVVDQMERMEQRINAPRSDIETLNARLGALEINLSEVSGALTGLTPPNMQPIEQKLDRIEAVGIDQDNARRSEMDILASRISHMSKHMNETQVDFSPMQSRLMALETALSDIKGSFQSLQTQLHAAQPSEMIERKLGSLENALLDLKMQKQAVDIDLGPVLDALYRMDSRLTELNTIENRMTSMEYGLNSMQDILRQRSDSSERRTEYYRRYEPETPPPQPRYERRDYSHDRGYEAKEPSSRSYRTTYVEETVRTSSDPISIAIREGDRSNLLNDAAFGSADDLEVISGVGPMLSALLNNIGVYYFWQIAEWSDADIAWVDDKLKHFKGRIERDDWVPQAKELLKDPTSAKRPV